MLVARQMISLNTQMILNDRSILDTRGGVWEEFASWRPYWRSKTDEHCEETHESITSIVIIQNGR